MASIDPEQIKAFIDALTAMNAIHPIIGLAVALIGLLTITLTTINNFRTKKNTFITAQNTETQKVAIDLTTDLIRDHKDAMRSFEQRMIGLIARLEKKPENQSIYSPIEKIENRFSWPELEAVATLSLKEKIKMDTKNTKELIGLVIKTANAIKDAGADGKIDIADIGLILPLIPAIGPAVENIASVPAELADMDQAEAQELIDMVKNDLKIGDEHTKNIIAASLKLVGAGVELIKAIKAPKVGS